MRPDEPRAPPPAGSSLDPTDESPPTAPEARARSASDDGRLWALVESVACQKRRRLALLCHARPFVPDDHAALDLVQEATIRVYRSPPRSRTEHAVAACLFRTVHRLGLNATRSRAKRPEPRDLTDELNQPTATWLDGVERLCHRERLRALVEALGGLTSLQREVVRLTQVDRLTQAEAARRLGITRSSVDHALRRAVDKLSALSRRGGQPRRISRGASPGG